MVRLRLNNRPIAFRSAMLAFLLLLSFSLKAQTVLYDEAVSGDLPGTGNGTALTISAAGTYTVSGTISSGADGQDRHQLTINSGLQLTAANYAIGGGGSPSGGQINWGGYANPTWGAGSSGSIGLTMPWAAGTYPQIMVAVNFSTGTTWTITYVAAATAAAPTITTSPSSTSVCAGGNTSFTVAASNTPTSYQWQVNTGSGYSNISNGGVYSGATSATLSITGATAGMNGYLYRATATNGTGTSSPSSAATLTVNSAPSITSNPANTSACAGGNASFTVAANNTPTSYQWQVDAGSGFTNLSNGGVYSNVTAATMNITGATAGMAGYQYRATATNGCGTSAASTAGTLSIGAAPAISTDPTNKTVCVGSNTTLTVAASNTPTSYQWQVNTGSGFTNISNGGVYSNATTATLSITSATVGMNGYLYRATATNACGTSSASASATLTTVALPTITGTTPGVACVGGSGAVGATVSSGGIVKWYDAASAGNYLGSGTTLTINPVSSAGTYYAEPVVIIGGNSVSTPYNANNGNAGAMFDVLVSNNIVLNDFQCNLTGTGTYEVYYKLGTYVGSETNSAAWTLLATSSSVASLGTGVATPLGLNLSFPLSAGQVYAFYITDKMSTGSVRYTNVGASGVSIGSNSDLTVYSGVGKGYPFAGTNSFRSINCTIDYSTTSCTGLSRSAVALSLYTSPSVSSHPSNSSVSVGANTSFSVTGTATGIAYQWQENTGSGWVNITNGGIYSNATTATLNLTAVTLAMNSYQYRCVISGTCTPVANSNAATLTVLSTPPVIGTDPVNAAICNGANTSFTTAATNTPTSYTWQVNTGSGYTDISNGGVYSNATTATLNITAVTAAMNGYLYRVIATNPSGSSAPSAAATLTVNLPPAIGTQPSNSTICSGTNTSFTVAATGAGIGYQWQLNTGAGWSNVANAGVYSNATTATLNITNAAAGMTGYQYRCYITGTCNNVTSNAATLTVTAAQSITTQPTNSTICAAGGTTFSVVANNAAGYQWYVNTGSGFNAVSNGGVYSGATTATLTITGATTGMSTYQYYCILSGNSPCTTTQSNTVTLTVDAPPVVNTQPSNAIVCVGDNTSFSVAATGTGIGYQWQVNTGSGFGNITNGGVYSNATTATLNITGVTGAMGVYQYRCLVTGTASCGNVTSNAATLTVNSLPSIIIQPNNSLMTVCALAGSASCTTIATGTGISFQWEENTGSGWNPLGANPVITNNGFGGLTFTNPPASMNGYQYRSIVSGTCTPAVTSNAVTLTVNSSPAIVAQALNSIICAGFSTSFSIATTGAGLTYQWQENTGSSWADITNGGVYSNATTVALGITAAPYSMNGYQYRCVVSGTCAPPVTGIPATLTVNSAAVVTAQPLTQTVCAGNNATFSTTAIGTNLTYQWYADYGSGFVVLTNGSQYSGVTTNTLSVTGANPGINGSLYQCRISTGSVCIPSVVNTSTVSLTVYSLPVIYNHPTASTICSGGNTAFAVTATGTGLTYQWQENTGSGFANITNGGIYSNATTSTLNLTGATVAMNTYQYRCVVGGTCPPSVTSNAAVLTVNSLPAVSTHPSNVTLCAGATATFTVAATGAGLTYQWQENTGSGFVNLVNTGTYFNVSTPTLSVFSATAGMNTYQYRCVVSGTCSPAATSNPATLIVNTAPAVTAQPVASVICLNGNTSYSVTATGTAVTYQWQLSTNGGGAWSNLTNTGVYSNVTTNSMNITAATAGMTGSLYRCVVSGTCAPVATSFSALLTVNIPPAVSAQPSNVTVCNNGNISFTVGATGTGLTYQWQQDPGTGFVNLTNGGAVTGATSPTLNIVAVTTAMNTYQYRCVVTGTCAPVATSNNAVLTVNPMITPSVSIAASATAICSGTSVTFTATPTNGGTTPVYVWKRGTTTVGTNSTTYTAANFLNGEVVTCQMTSNAACITTATVASNAVTMAVTPSVTPSLLITTPNNPVCSGSTVLFTAIPTNGGSTPAYQWRKNGSPVGTGATTYSDNTLVNGDVISCVLTSNAVCATTTTANSNNIAMGINPIVVPAVSISTSSTTRCAGQSTVFTAVPTNGGTSPTYQWQVNGFTVGTNSSTYTTTTLNNGDVVNCVLISNAPCPSPFSATSNSLTMTVIPLIAPTIAISSDFGTQACQNVATTFTAVITNGGTAPIYQWRRNGSPVGTNSATYVAPTLNNGDIITCVLASSAPCATPSSVTSNSLTMTVNPVGKATVGIFASPDSNMCVPSSGLTFYSNYTNGGSTPAYQWNINGTPVPGATSATFFATSLQDLDAVTLRFSSSAICVFPEISSAVTIHQYPVLKHSVNITMTNVGPGQTQFTANIINGGVTPSVQWYKNDKAIPTATNLTHTESGLTSSDRISVEVISTAICATPKSLMSNYVSVTTGIHNVAQAGLKFGLYPNPVSTDRINLIADRTLQGETVVRLINKLGQLVSEHKVMITTGAPTEIVIGDIAAGTYYLQVINTTENIKTNIKFDKN